MGKRGNCKRRKMSLRILPVLAGDCDQQITWFQQRGLIARNKTCPSCRSPMRIQCRNNIQEKRRYSHLTKLIKHIISWDLPLSLCILYTTLAYFGSVVEQGLIDLNHHSLPTQEKRKVSRRQPPATDISQILTCLDPGRPPLQPWSLGTVAPT